MKGYISKTCHICGSLLTERKWVYGNSYILCHGCGVKVGADVNAAYNIALRCRDDAKSTDEHPSKGCECARWKPMIFNRGRMSLVDY